MTTFGATSDDRVGIIITLWLHCILSISGEIALSGLHGAFLYHELTLFQLMAWCREAAVLTDYYPRRHMASPGYTELII